MKKQVDDINHLEDQVTPIRTQRAMELAKITLSPPWDAGDPSTWVFHGWTPPAEGIPAWDKDDPS
eukprot:627593-Pyramimonas_sp.AAC.1